MTHKLQNNYTKINCHTGKKVVAQPVKNLPANVRDTGSIPGSVRFPGEGNGNPLKHSCQGSALDRGAWWATVHGVAKESDTT